MRGCHHLFRYKMIAHIPVPALPPSLPACLPACLPPSLNLSAEPTSIGALDEVVLIESLLVDAAVKAVVEGRRAEARHAHVVRRLEREGMRR